MVNRVFLLGYRKDFAALIKHIDILLNSYPFSGGLFCQTAARFSKPILAFSGEDYQLENSVEDILCYNPNNRKISFVSEEEFYKYAHRLIIDSKFRKENGQYVNSLLQTELKFNKQLFCLLIGKYSHVDRKSITYVDRLKRILCYIGIRNKLNPDYLGVLAHQYGVFILFKFHFLNKEFIKHYSVVVKYMFADSYVLSLLYKKMKRLFR